MEIRLEVVPGEEREGFYVPSIVRRAWLVELDVLKEIDKICRRHNIKYFAQWGTLLGAIRHQGFIPWDDDLDISMLRNDFERFLYYARMELPEGWQITKKFPTLVRIENSNMIRVDQEFLDKYHGCPYMIGVDLFSMDYLPENKADEEVFAALFTTVNYLYNSWLSFEKGCTGSGGGLTETERWERLEEVEKLTGRLIDRQGSIVWQLYDLAENIAAMYWDTDYKEVTHVRSLFEQPEYRIPRACFDRIIEVPFENTTIPILEDYELMLRLDFGDDYMMPVQNAASHEYPFFKNQIEMLRDWFEKQGIAFPEFFDIMPSRD